MRPSEYLFDLIHSLSKNEKRYFKRFCSQYSDQGGKNYIKLFNAILKQKSFEQEELLRKFRNEDFVKHFSAAKNYLYKLILKSMRAYRAEKNALIHIRELQTDTDILQEKGLYRQALKQIRKARKLAAEHELNILLLEILIREKWLVKQVQERSAEGETGRIHQAIEATIAHVKREVAYGIAFDRFYFAQEKMDTQEDLNVHLRNIIRTTFNHGGTDSFQSRHLEYQIRGFYHRLRGEVGESQACHSRTREWWEAHPKIIDIYPLRYKQILRNCLQNYSYQGNRAQFDSLIAKIQALPDGSLQTEIPIRRDMLFTRLLFLLNTGEFEDGRKLVPEIEAFLDEFGDHISAVWTLSFYYNLCLIAFLFSESEQALRWANEIINYPRTSVRADLQFAARLMRLLLHYDLENYDLVEYLLRSTLDYCRKDETYQPLAQVLARGLQRLLNAIDGQEGALSDTLREIGALEEAQNVRGAFEIRIWLQNRLTGEARTSIAHTP